MLIFSTSIFIDGDRKEEHLVDRCSNFPRRSLQTTVTARKNTSPIDDIFPRRSLQTVAARKNTTSIDVHIFRADLYKQQR